MKYKNDDEKFDEKNFLLEAEEKSDTVLNGSESDAGESEDINGKVRKYGILFIAACIFLLSMTRIFSCVFR